MAKTTEKTATKTLLSHKEFCHRSIKKHRNLEKGRGLHTVYSGFLSAFKEYYDCDSATAVDILKGLAKKGDIEMHYAKGGSIIYLPGEMPERADRSNEKFLNEIL